MDKTGISVVARCCCTEPSPMDELDAWDSVDRLIFFLYTKQNL
jgi:hypothetical protein